MLTSVTLLALAGALGATCAGFGCNDYRGQDFPGLTNAAPGSMPYSDFLAAIKEKRILGVDFKGIMERRALAELHH